MPTLTLEGLSDETYRALEERAAANHRSLNTEVIVRLERSVAAEPVDVTARLARIDALREQIRAEWERHGVRPLTPGEVRAAIEEGRP